VVYHPQLHYLTFDLKEYLGGEVSVADIITHWCWDMEDFLRQSQDPWAKTLLDNWPLKGVGLNEQVVPVDTSTVPGCLLDTNLTLDLFRVKDTWYSVITDQYETKHPCIVEVPDPSRLTMLSTAQLVGPTTSWYWTYDHWVGSAEIIPSVSTEQHDRDRDNQNGLVLYCPITGAPLNLNLI
jgi:hypothetical protein